jgi:hypothetical protein
MVLALGAQAALVIDQNLDQRVDDTDSNGSGNRVVGTNRLIGYHTSVQNMHVVYVFQMTGVTNVSEITSVDFSVTQAGVNSAFAIDAHVIRTSLTNTVISSDYETTAATLMEDFSDNSKTGLKSLSAAGQTNLATYLQANWSEGAYVFIGLKTDPFTIVSDSNKYGSFNSDAQLTIYRGDETSESEEPEEPTNLELVMALGNLTNAPAVYTTNGVVTNVNCVGTIQSMMYDGVDYTGKATRVWAYIGMPAGASASNPVPAVVCVHGGGGTAYSAWVQQWNDRGYAAIAMDTEGRMVDSATGDKFVHEWGGPQRTGIYDKMDEPIGDHFMYHATADAILANSLLRSLPEVNPDQVGICGVSWGGVITSTAIGIDDRFAFAIPTYGCGHMYDAMSHWGPILEDNEIYKTVWDPVLRLTNATLPVLWFSFPTEDTFPMDSFAYSYHALAGPHMASLVPGMGHSHPATYLRPESYDFADNIISNGTGWCVQQSLSLTGSTVEVVFAATRTLKTASLLYATGNGNVGDLPWTETNVTSFVESPAGTWTITAQLPEDATGWFVNTTAAPNVSGYRGGDVIASSDYQEVIHLIPTPADQLEISHPVFTNQSTSTVEVAFTGPTNVEISDIRVSGQSHPGAFTNLTAAPMVLTDVAPTTTSVRVKFDNIVAGLTNGQSATATLVIVWDELDGSVSQMELPLCALAWGGTNAVYGTWALSNGLSGAAADLSADPDGDGKDNLFEYARGSFPNIGNSDTSDAANFPRLGTSSAGVDYIYRRRLNAGLSYMLEASSNLVSGAWSTNGIFETGIGAVDTDFEVVTNCIPATDAGFVRLTIELSE